ncbi:hypothetical protein BWI96_05825 [Siphonobacter sp. SORGH_AS_0500]|uniref:head GIN domain-containing protein n=1 Tax=Siphonobacter sp. SORGH_AS_0500 TaxID=1864824 RepID=UPI000CC6FE35|nr:head GIN domain-containing protein [Siphonobacter sp. SORGH_AS_0500]PKK37389.1 hypothetical protein BWI96_05825 [Siphonobacter sp. SORGH_AS_0500]
MKKALLSIALVLGITGALQAQNWQQARSVGNFTAIQANSGIDLYLTQGNSNSLKLEVKGYEEKEVITEIKDGTLMLKIDRNRPWGSWGGSGRSVKAYISFKTLEKLRASGGSDVYSQNQWSVKDLTMDLSGGSDAKVELKAEHLVITAGGGSDAYLKGSAGVFEAVASGGSDIKASGFKAGIVRVKASGGSDAHVHADEEITAEASGGSDINYSGNAKEVGIRKSGGSDVNRRN